MGLYFLCVSDENIPAKGWGLTDFVRSVADGDNSSVVPLGKYGFGKCLQGRIDVHLVYMSKD